MLRSVAIVCAVLCFISRVCHRCQRLHPYSAGVAAVGLRITITLLGNQFVEDLAVLVIVPRDEMRKLRHSRLYPNTVKRRDGS
jgi:hypothetical protein